jgi:hypothetical protein
VQDTRAKENAEIAAIEGYWESLSPAQQKQLDAEVLAEADAADRKACATSPAVAKMILRTLRHARIREMLARH